ncbi:hypothetical protein BLS_009972 [Venturia inaequalis]|uniref:Polyketide synthase n=1 Tax=Venturia inaequalis TaxID=5025 RepID=A0A8H3U482_VENIN|nr:hypothetical protein BLS_009972 [Venturia inaequalis]
MTENLPVKKAIHSADNCGADIAIIGMACRFAGECTDPQKLWDFVLAGRSAAEKIPVDRMSSKGFYHPDKNRVGAICTETGCFLRGDITAFDAPFFAISKAEADAMDPQQRLLLENAYHALENAGLSMNQIAGSNTSVFVGSAFNHDFQTISNTDLDNAPKYRGYGTNLAMLSNRVSWFFDLKGQSLTIDTACSSGLVALHHACSSLQSKDSEMAVVSGVNLILHHTVYSSLSPLSFLSADGISYSFDHRATGYGRGEGVGTLVVKPLSAALRDGNTIRAVIKATGVNQDGRTIGISQPSAQSQEALITSVYAKAGLNLNDTCYVEAHGTGTAVGDPLEVEAIVAAFKTAERSVPLSLGSVKANIGHTEGAAGLAGLIKAVKLAESGVIPPLANFEMPNPSIATAGNNLHFPVEPSPWPLDGCRQISINSFGFGGTNAHAVIQSFRSPPRLVQDNDDVSAYTGHPAKIIVVSAADESGVDRQCVELKTWSEQLTKRSTAPPVLGDVAHTLSCHRTNFAWRSFLLTSDVSGLQDSGLLWSTPTRARAPPPKIGFVFTGQGAQWPAMGNGLKLFPEYQKSIEDASQFMLSLGSTWCLTEELEKSSSESQIDSPFLAQCSTTVIQMAIVDLLKSWHVLPSRVMGHSSGEIAAAYACGRLSKQDAWKVAYYRGYVSQHCCSMHGAMLAVAASPVLIESYIDRVKAQKTTSVLVIACYNSSRNLTISGDRHAIGMLKELLGHDNIFARQLNFGNAYHSPHMVTAASEYITMIGELSSPRFEGHPSAEMSSSVTGTILTRTATLDATYWAENLVSPVKFSAAFTAMCGIQKNDSVGPFVQHILEIGPHPAMRTPIKHLLEETSLLGKVGSHHVLNRGEETAETILRAAAVLWCAGHPVNLEEVNGCNTRKAGTSPKLLNELFPYSFNHSKSFWAEGRLSRNTRLRQYPRHDLLGAPVADWNTHEPKWRNRIRRSELPWVMHHKISEKVIYPGAGFVIMALEASKQISPQGVAISGYRFCRVAFKTALEIPDTDEGIEVSISLRPQPNSQENESWKTYDFRVYSFQSTEWIQHCSGAVSVEYELSEDTHTLSQDGNTLQNAREAFERSCRTEPPTPDMYGVFSSLGLGFGSTFQNLGDVKFGGQSGRATGTVTVPDITPTMPSQYTHPHLIHPATLDSMLHIFFAAVTDSPSHGRDEQAMLPSSVSEAWISASGCYDPGSKFRCHGEARTLSAGKWVANVSVWNHLGEPCVTIKELNLSSMGSSTLLREPNSIVLHKMAWEPAAELLLSAATVINRAEKSVDEGEHFIQLQKYQLASSLLIRDALSKLSQHDPALLQPHQQRYMKWLKHEDGLLKSGALPLYEEVLWKTCYEDRQVCKNLFNEVAKMGAQGELLTLLGPQICSVLHDRVEALEVMFREHSLMDRFYSQMSLAENLRPYLTSYLHLLRHSCTQLRILEIGAGTGSATQVMLESLIPLDRGANIQRDSTVASYCFTDISMGFFGKAKEKFEPWLEHMDFRTLNIEMDPSEQGFDMGSFDIIVAAQARWWLGKEDTRLWSPLLDEGQWLALLARTHFEEKPLIFYNVENESSRNHALIIAMADVMPDREAEEHSGLLVICGSHDQKRGQLATSLLKDLASRTTHNAQAIVWNELANFDLVDQYCVVLWDLVDGCPLLGNAVEFTVLKDLLYTCNKLIWVCKDHIANPQSALMTGVMRTVKWERSHDDISFIVLECGSEHLNEDVIVRAVFSLIENGLSGAVDSVRNGEFRLQQGELWTNRVTEEAEVTEALYHMSLKRRNDIPQARKQRLETITRPIKLHISTPGVLGALEFVEDEAWGRPLGVQEIEVQIMAVALSPSDLMLAMGEVLKGYGTGFGIEGAGIVSRCGANVNQFRSGDRVVCLKTLFHIPAHMLYEDAVSIPTPFKMANHGLLDVARLVKGDTVLIHPGSDAISQAAIQIAQKHGARVFVTASNLDEQELLTKRLKVPKNLVLSLSDHSFADHIEQMTGAKGVNVVLNSDARHDARARLWKCTATSGRFVDLRQAATGESLDMEPFMRGATYNMVDSSTLMYGSGRSQMQETGELLAMLLAGEIQTPWPLHLKTYSDIESSFRQMQAGDFQGRIILCPDKDDLVSVVPGPLPEYQFAPDASYVIAGGLGGLGQSIAEWMVSRGAKHLILISRSLPQSAEIKASVQNLMKTGCQVTLLSCDISSKHELDQALAGCSSSLPPIKGCIQAAMVLDDAAFMNMTHEQFMAAVLPKMHGSFNLAQLLPNELDFFIMLSSVTGIIGNRGQGNYTAGGCFQDAFAHHLRSQGIKASTIDLASVKGVGYAARRFGDGAAVKEVDFMTPEEVHDLINYHITSSNSQNCQTIGGLISSATFAERNIQEPAFMSIEKYKHDRPYSVEALLTTAESMQAAGSIITQAIAEKMSSMMSLAAADVDTSQSLSIYGVDSLVAVGLRSWFGKADGADVSILDILGRISIGELGMIAAQKSTLVAVKEMKG